MNATSILSVRFFIKKYKAKNNCAPVYARITVEGNSVDLSLKRDIDVNSWNPSRGLAKGNREEIKVLNSYLEHVRADITNCYTELKVQKKLVTPEAIKNMLCGTTPPEHTLKALMEYHNTYLKDTLEWGTMKNYMTTQKYAEMFLYQKRRTSDIALSELTYGFLADFEKFLREYKPRDHHKPCGHNTILKHIERLRKMVNLAIKNEWLSRDPFTKFRARFIRNDREFLSEKELETIENKEFQMARLQWAKDLFVFSCYTGLAYCDVMSLTSHNLSLRIDGECWIMTARKKTNQPVRVPVLPKALEIIEKYKNHPKALATGTLFPNLSNQKLNAYLKEIADLCGIQKNLTFHLARHTFATTVTLTNGVPIETVSSMLGHSSIRTTQIYAKVIERKISDDMKSLKEKLSRSSSKLAVNH